MYFLSIGMHCLKCEFNAEDIQNEFDINRPEASRRMPNCAFDNLYHTAKSKNYDFVWRCKSCGKANVYLKGKIILSTKQISPGICFTVTLQRAFETIE